MNASLFSLADGYLKKSDRLLLVLPEKASLDAWTGLLATKYYLESIGKETLAVCSGAIPQSLGFLELQEGVVSDILPDGDFVISINTEDIDIEQVQYHKGETSLDILLTPKNGRLGEKDLCFRQSVGSFDTVIGFGMKNLESLGRIFEDHPYLFSDIPMIHFSVDPSGEIGKVPFCMPEKSAICEILVEFFEKAGLSSFDETLSTILLTGILSATDSFLNSHTTGQSLAVAAKLQQSGARQSDIIDHVFKQKSFLTLKLWGSLLQSLSFDADHKVVWGRLNRSDFERLGAEEMHLEDIGRSIIRFVEGTELSVLAVESEEGIVMQLRSPLASYDFSYLKALGDEVIYEEVPNGVNLSFEKGRLSKVENQVLGQVVTQQKKRLRIEGEGGLTASDYKSQETGVGSQESEGPSIGLKEKPAQGGGAHAPENVPFSIGK